MNNSATYEQALALLSEKRFVEAYPLFKQCIGDSGLNQSDVLFNCGWCLENIGNSQKKALYYYQSCYESATVGELKLNAGFRYSWVLMEEKNYPQAQHLLSKILAETKLSLTKSLVLRHAVFWFAVCLELDSRFLEAIDFYRKLETVNDQNLELEAQYRKIVCLNQVGNLEAALQSADEFLHLPSFSGDEGLRQSELIRLVKDEKCQIERALAEA